MIQWTAYHDKPPIPSQRVLLGRRDYGYSATIYDFYFARLVHPYLESKRYNPEWFHWIVIIDGKEQIYEVAGDDVWSELNAPDSSAYRLM